MNILNIINNKYFKIFIIALLIALIVILCTENFTNELPENFTNKLPPHVDQLVLQQLEPQIPPVAVQTPSESNKSGESIDPPNYKRHNVDNTPEKVNMIPGNIYRMNTGREAYQQEQFVSIYDSNFGGLLGTTLGTSFHSK